MTGAPAHVRYRFGGYLLSPRRRSLRRDGLEVGLIPRYFDLLLLLVRRRHEAVHRREIFDAVWADVVVSDGALSQAVRTLRRALGDDPREPRFIRTVSRHGYQFSFADLIEEPDDAPPAARSEATPVPAPSAPLDAYAVPLALLLDAGADEHERRDAAETLHALGTAEALRRLDRQPGHETARALLRDARWDVPGSGDVPIFGRRGGLRAFRALMELRMRLAVRLVRRRWSAASAGGALAGGTAGLVGGLFLWIFPGSVVSLRAPAALCLAGALIGGAGAAGVGAGLTAAEALVRSWRGTALVLLGGAGGAAVGALAHALARFTLEGMFGRDLAPLGGGLEGLVIGAAAGLGYALSTPTARGGGMATPHGTARARAALATALCCAAAGVGLTWSGSLLGGVSMDYVARSFPGSEIGLQPLAELFGETEAGPATRTVLAIWEGLLFGVGLVLGLTRRPTLSRLAATAE